MLGKIPKQSNKNAITNPNETISILSKYNSSKIRRNSTTLFLEKFQKEYASKYLTPNNKNIKAETIKPLSPNFVIKTPKNCKKSQFNNNLNNLNTNLEKYLEKIYQNEKHLKKNILKKKNDHNKKSNLKVSFNNFTPKKKFLKFNSKKLTFSNYVNDNSDNKGNNNGTQNEKENIIEEEDGQSYGYNKKYSLKIIDEKENDKKNEKKEETTPKLTKNSLFNKIKPNEINKEGDDTHKTFNTTNVRSSEANNIKVPRLKIKKSRIKPNIKKLKKKTMKSAKEQEENNKNSNVVNINYNINVNNNKNGNKKSFTVYNDNLNRTEKESNERDKNKDNSSAKKSYKDDDNNNIIPKKKKYKINCCYPFIACLRGFNE